MERRIGVVAVPQAFGVNAAPPSDCLTAWTGILSAAALARPAMVTS